MRSHRHHGNSQRGVAMFICLFALLLLTAIGMALMYSGDTETSINSNFRSSQAAYYAAKAGVEEGRERLRYGNTYSIPWVGAPAGLLASTATAWLPNNLNGLGVVYIINNGPGEVVTPWITGSTYADDELCHENYAGLGLGGPFPLGVPCTVNLPGGYYTQAPVGLPNSSLDPGYNTNAAMPYKWVRITLKQVGSTSPYCIDGAVSCRTAAEDANFNKLVCAQYNNGTVPPTVSEIVNPGGLTQPCEATGNLRSVYLVTALAVTNTGARRMVQYEVADVSLPPFPAALTLNGPMQNNNAHYVANNPPPGNIYTPNSGVFKLSGNNAATCGPGGPNMPGVGGIDQPGPPAQPNAANIAGQINNPCNNCGPSRPGEFQGAGGATPNVANVQPNTDPMLQTCAGIQSLYNNLAAAADQTFTIPPNAAPSLAQLGSPAAPLVTIINGDYSLGAGGPGAGVLVVTGNLTMSGNNKFDGVILAIGKGNVQASGGGNGYLNGAMFVANCFDAAGHWIAGVPNPPVWDFSGGGNWNLQYDSCWTNNLTNHMVYKILASREEIY